MKETMNPHRLRVSYQSADNSGNPSLLPAPPCMDLDWAMAPACRPVVVKATVLLLALCLAAYIVGPQLYWHVSEALSASVCPACSCDCAAQPIITLSQDFTNVSLADCAKHDKDDNGDTERNFTELLAEELKMREMEMLENQKKVDMRLLEAKKLTSQYQKEADKCNSGMETCEEAREKADAVLQAQKKLSEVWEMRARQRGWKENPKLSTLKKVIHKTKK